MQLNEGSIKRCLIYPEAKINKKIRWGLELIVEQILNIIDSPQAIILTGGFGRGEGGAIVEAGKARILNDYDIVIVTNQISKKQEIINLSSTLPKIIDIDFVDLGLMRPRWLKKLPPSIFAYDLKYASKVIFGDESVLEKISRMSPEDIPNWEGLRLLFNRMAGVLGGFSNDIFNKKLNSKQKNYLRIQVNHALTACGDALIVSKKKYHHLYRRRLELFQDLYKNDKFDLNLSDEEFEWISEGYRRKLSPASSYKKNVDDELILVLPIIKKVFSYCMANYVEYPNQNSVELDALINEYIHKELISFKNWKMFFKKTIMRKIKREELYSFPIIHRIYGSLPLILFSAPFYQKDLSQLKESFKILKIKYEKDSYPDNWERIRQLTYHKWEEYCH